jgi:hypothetical protein
MCTSIRSITKSCRACQVNKKRKLKYGHLPPKTIITVPWRVLCVDLIGPYTLKGKDGTIIDFMALTMINPATSWIKVVELLLIRRLKTVRENGKESFIVEEIFDKTSEHIARLVNKIWLSRYPSCHYIIYDNGSEFKLNFEYLCVTYGINRKPTMMKNPQANAILERSHQVLAQMLCTSKLDMAETITPDNVNVFLDNTAWAICSTYHTVLKASPVAAIFGRDMLFDIPLIANWNKIGDCKQRQTNLNMARKNSKQVDYDLQSWKLGSVDTGRYPLQSRKPIQQKAMDYRNNSYKWNYQVSTQNTKLERLNIRRVTPFVDE